MHLYASGKYFISNKILWDLLVSNEKARLMTSRQIKWILIARVDDKPTLGGGIIAPFPRLRHVFKIVEKRNHIPKLIIFISWPF